MEQSVFTNFRDLNKTACAGCACINACTKNTRTKHRRLVALGCDLQALFLELENRLGGLEMAEWKNIVPVALATLGHEPARIKKALVNLKEKDGDKEAEVFRRLLLLELRNVSRVFLENEKLTAKNKK